MITWRTDGLFRTRSIFGKAGLHCNKRSIGAPAVATVLAALIVLNLDGMAWAQDAPQPPEIGDQLPTLAAPATPSSPAAATRPAAEPEEPNRDSSPATSAGVSASGSAREDRQLRPSPEAAVPEITTEVASSGLAPKTGSGGDPLPVESAEETAQAQSSSERLPTPAAVPGDTTEPILATMETTSKRALSFLRDGGPAIWAIAALSVATCALILWKVWRLALLGAWSRGKSGQAVEAYLRGETSRALALVEGRRGIRSQVMATTLHSLQRLSTESAREETARVAKRQLASARDGLGALELIATIAPLLGLLGTVLGMIAAFQALQAAGSRADPALLAGGIWEALLTTAAGMAVAIPASAALTWFEAVVERVRRDIEDNAVRVFVASQAQGLKLAAE